MRRISSRNLTPFAQRLLKPLLPRPMDWTSYSGTRRFGAVIEPDPSDRWPHDPLPKRWRRAVFVGPLYLRLPPIQIKRKVY
jgi:hypothetical protein